MFAKYQAVRELQSLCDKYNRELDSCTDSEEKDELIQVIENLEWVIKDLGGSSEEPATQGKEPLTEI